MDFYIAVPPLRPLNQSPLLGHRGRAIRSLQPRLRPLPLGGHDGIRLGDPFKDKFIIAQILHALFILSSQPFHILQVKFKRKGELKMTGKIMYRILAGLLLIAALAGIAYFAYQAGAAHIPDGSLQIPQEGTTVVPNPYFMLPVPFFGFGCLIPLAVLFLICLAFGSMRRLVWGPRWSRRHWNHDPEACKGRLPWREGVPPFFAEWHRRVHAAPEDDKASGQK
jgi:hypothetical protein